MNYRDWTVRRMAFKKRVAELLADPRRLTYGEIGQIVGRSAKRIGQIRNEMSIPRRGYGRNREAVDLSADIKSFSTPGAWGNRE
jgi:hypothetical protein